MLHRTPIDSSDSQPANNNFRRHQMNSAAQNVSTENRVAAATEKNGNQQNTARGSASNSNGASFYAYAPNENMHQQYLSYTGQPYYDSSYSSYDYCG